MIRTDALNEPAVRAFVSAVNAGDRDAFHQALTENATMSDDGSDRMLDEWADQEIFDSHGHMGVQSQDAAGRTLIADYCNDTWGEMRTKWHFTVDDGKISRFDTGQA